MQTRKFRSSSSLALSPQNQNTLGIWGSLSSKQQAASIKRPPSTGSAQHRRSRHLEGCEAAALDTEQVRCTGRPSRSVPLLYILCRTWIKGLETLATAPSCMAHLEGQDVLRGHVLTALAACALKQTWSGSWLELLRPLQCWRCQRFALSSALLAHMIGDPRGTRLTWPPGI
jgi:hypothetical protein